MLEYIMKKMSLGLDITLFKKEIDISNEHFLLDLLYNYYFDATILEFVVEEKITITLPINEKLGFSVDWGDGCKGENNASHEYKQTGTFCVKIYGDVKTLCKWNQSICYLTKLLHISSRMEYMSFKHFIKSQFRILVNEFPSSLKCVDYFPFNQKLMNHLMSGR